MAATKTKTQHGESHHPRQAISSRMPFVRSRSSRRLCLLGKTCEVRLLISAVVQYSGNGGTRLSSHQSSGLHPFCPTPPKYYNRKGASQAHCPRQLISDCVAEGANEYTDCTSIVSSSGSQFPQSSVLELAAAGIPSEKLVIGKFATVSNTTTGFMDPKNLGECVSSATQHGWSASLPELSPF